MISVTPLAAEKFRELVRDEKKEPEKTALRVFVQGGGCSGFQYGLMLNEEDRPGDLQSESNGIRVVVDPISITYVKDAEVDFVESPTGGGFSIKNPQATSTCGCGSSFNTE